MEIVNNPATLIINYMYKALRNLLVILTSISVSFSNKCLTATPQTNTKTGDKEQRFQDILFVVIDDLNQFVSVLDNRPGNFLSKVFLDDQIRGDILRELTPNLQKLAKHSVVFTNAYCSVPLCGPSRASLLTSVSAHVSGYYDHTEGHFRDFGDLDHVATLPEYLRTKGYQTIGIGKVFHSPVQRFAENGQIEDWPDIGRSWSDYVERPVGSTGNKPKIKDALYSFQPNLEAAWRAKFPDEKTSPIGRFDKALRFGTIDQSLEDTADFENARYATQILQTGNASISDTYGVKKTVSRDFSRPMFLALGLYTPHLPWFVPKEYWNRVPIEKMELNETLKNWVEEDIKDIPDYAMLHFIGHDWSHLKMIADYVGGNNSFEKAWGQLIQAYLAAVAYADACLGPLVEAYEAIPEAKRPILVLWSDHGWNLGDKSRFRKHALWDGASHNVLMISAPGRTPQEGGVTSNVVSLLDVYPTLLSLLDLPIPQHVQGKSLCELLLTPTTPSNGYALTTYHSGNHAIRTNEFTYIRYATGEEELYDALKDPFERNNLASNPNFKLQLTEASVLLNSALQETPQVEQPGEAMSHND